MKFKLEITCDNAAFHPEYEEGDEEGGDSVGDEVQRILREAAGRIVVGTTTRLVDYNGNTVGKAWFEED